ncbi:MAG: thioredoxin family protein [Firmicutes bacterium]|nr:thioredoxin family protein [Bacillota bacterium]
MVIKVLGSGCSNCKKLEKNTKEAVKELGLDAKVEKVEDIKDIMGFGVMKTPALVVDEKVVLKGRVAKTDEIVTILKNS